MLIPPVTLQLEAAQEVGWIGGVTAAIDWAVDLYNLSLLTAKRDWLRLPQHHIGPAIPKRLLWQGIASRPGQRQRQAWEGDRVFATPSTIVVREYVEDIYTTQKDCRGPNFPDIPPRTGTNFRNMTFYGVTRVTWSTAEGKWAWVCGGPFDPVETNVGVHIGKLVVESQTDGVDFTRTVHDKIVENLFASFVQTHRERYMLASVNGKLENPSLAPFPPGYVFPWVVTPGYVEEDKKTRPVPFPPVIPIPKPDVTDPPLPMPDTPDTPGVDVPIAPPLPVPVPGQPGIPADRPGSVPKPVPVPVPPITGPALPGVGPLPVPAPPVEVVPPWAEVFPPSIVGNPAEAPAATLVGIAAMTGKLEEKLKIMNNKLDTPETDPDWIGPIKDLIDFFTSKYDEGEYLLQGPCEYDSTGNLKEPLKARWAGGRGAIEELKGKVDALAELIQHHKTQGQPVCIKQRQGQPVTVILKEEY